MQDIYMRCVFIFIVIPTILAVMAWCDRQQIKRGEVIVFTPKEGVFSGRKILVNKSHREVHVDIDFFSKYIITENSNGEVRYKEALHNFEVDPFVHTPPPPDEDDIKLYRTYFPKQG